MISNRTAQKIERARRQKRQDDMEIVKGYLLFTVVMLLFAISGNL